MDPTKTPSPLFTLETCPPVTDEEFNLFHTIDRELYTRLIQSLGRDPAELIQVMAFWMWLEKQSSDMYFIKRILSLPLDVLRQLVHETITCLKCVESDKYPFGSNDNPNEIIILPDLLNNRVITIRFFHDNRIAVLKGVSKIINNVCARVFRDILQRACQVNVANLLMQGFRGHSIREVGETSIMAEQRNQSVVGHGGMVLPVYQPYYNVPLVSVPPAVAHGLIQIPQPPTVPPSMVEHGLGFPIHMVGGDGLDFVTQQQILGNELGEMLSQSLSISSREEISNVNFEEDGKEDGGEEVPPDDRTIFLTFSKGYPISEDEVREFFTRRFGDFIEDIIMQEVGEDEQVLYARMVARSLSVIDGIVGGNKAKYSINGKHVWARKYVKKQQPTKSPPRGEGSSRPGEKP